ncbi:macro domain-containing protein [Halomonas sp. McH1-25]|uniref:macro domain-containing protein n=1 Tax=unclassified Halomonas TaxID=2609666 RepID=UPI001EF66D81|nr:MULTISPECIES: macro domain-containing protein [unclassified Halomonas]MCG7599208.1 macro domain-containing protein [Halomonas sp. McH1-25]MCP1341076.1 macro domain-containing protein [Halomonas sp. FL8]MCP1361704.1 macro domain-containing protein [Halomonas sp. BBD45]MCP1365218.1 macro domain-containing protein [Halomonas sp. BBD48]
MSAQPHIECVQGDIAQQPDMEAVVNAANADLTIGGGVAGALHRAAGPGLEEECRPMAPIRPGQAVISGAHKLPNRYVIHCLGPVYGVDEPADELLASCYREAIRLAEDKSIASLAFPSLSTGAFGYPMPDATRIALDTVIQASRDSHSLRHIRFVLFSEDAVRIHQQILGSLQEP